MIMSDIELDHVAIAVDDLDKIEKVYQDLGLSFKSREEVKSEKVLTSFAPVTNNEHQHSPANIELLLGTDDTSAISKYISKKHQVYY